MGKTKYNKDTTRKVEEWIAQNGLDQPFGATVTEFSIAMGWNPDTHYEYRKRYPAYSESIEKGRDRFTAKSVQMAEHGLKQLIAGDTIEERTTKYAPDAHGKPVIVEDKVKKHRTPPNTAAVIFALTNLNPDKWKNRQNTDLTSGGEKITQPTPIVVATDDQKAALNELLGETE